MRIMSRGSGLALRSSQAEGIQEPLDGRVKLFLLLPQSSLFGESAGGNEHWGAGKKAATQIPGSRPWAHQRPSKGSVEHRAC